MAAEGIICPVCRKEGMRSKVFLYSNPNINYRGGYYNEDGELVIPEMNFEPPWYMCSYGHITQTFNSESVTSSSLTKS